MKKAESFILSKGGKITVIASGALTAVISLIMNIILIPKIESTTEGIRCFDMNFAYNFETAEKFLKLLSDEGRALYLNVQLPLDFIYPAAYCIFFTFLIVRLVKRVNALVVFPLMLTAFDVCENVCSIIMLRSARLSQGLAAAGSAFTSIKTILMYIMFIVIIICIVFCFKNMKKA